jgi:hypothetical protein
MIASLFALALIGMVQIRFGFDALTSFTGLVPLSILLTASATVITMTRHSWAWTAIAALLLSLALTTYETVILFVPALVALVIYSRKSWTAGLSLAIPAMVDAALVLYLRLHTESGSKIPAYTVSLEPVAVITTFSQQFLGALPLAQWWLGSLTVPHISLPLIAILFFLIGIPTFIASRIVLAKFRAETKKRTIVVMASVGLWIWVTSSMITAVTARWQADLQLGQAYLNVIYEYFGVALCFTALMLWLLNLLQTDHKASATTSRLVTALALILASTTTLTLAGNLSIPGI